MTFRSLAFCAIAAGLSACAAAGRPAPAPAPSAPAPAPPSPPVADEPSAPGGQTADADQEAIYSATMGKAGLTARVNSNGCTKRADFRALVLEGYPAPTVILQRKRPDMCRALVAGGVDLLFTYGELKLKPNTPIVLGNPLVADPSPGR